MATAHPARIKQSAFVKKLNAFGKKLPVFVEAHLKGREVQHPVVRLGFAKIGNEGHVKRKGIADAVLDVHTAVEGMAVTGRFAVFGIFVDVLLTINGDERGCL